ncbi:T9SS type A sorting domain-containing protein [Winogradskyella helgolandensis]|uniref:T9SS type A sorting domain-containing protein n=1 Tax=Winogradskyella helgolandensis TaxID=2697010 RepID=UPI0015C9FFDF|nr:T9SS type A sorting domain-containing protein [Winogradskyella helgolandensis]
MKKLYFLLTTVLLTQIALAQPANDDCATAETIAVTTTASTVNFEIAEATITNEIGCAESTSDYADIWYNITMPVNGNLYVDGTIGWNNFALYDTCGGTQLQCGSGNQLFTDLTATTNYKLRLFRTEANADNNGYRTFTIQAFEAVTNDDCASAENIAVTTEVSTVNFDIGGAAINNEIGCAETTNNYADIWYDFTMPVNGNLYVDGTIGWNNFALYDTCGGTQLQCGSDNQLFTNLTATTNYKLRLFRTEANADNNGYRTFTIQAFEAVSNDDCASAENIAVTTEASTIDFDIAGAAINNEIGCAETTNDYADIWYDLTMPVNGNLYVDGTIGWNNFALYDACGGTQLQCGSDNQLFTDLTATTNYKLRLFRTLANADNNGYRTFTIQAFEAVSNDDCASSENITVTTTASTVDFDIAGAAINNEIGCAETTNDYADIWYDFTMPVNGNLYVDGTIGWNNFALYDACGGTQLQCGSDNQLFTDLTATTNYKLRVFRTLANADIDNYKTFTIQAFEAVSNDDCASAENITVITSESIVNFDIAGAAINNEIGCAETTNDYADIWYDFTMPVNGNLYVDGTIGWNNFALYDACGGTQLQCGSGNQLFTDLTATTNYKLRLFRTLANADNDTYRTFTIQAFEIITNDDCDTAETITISDTPTTVNFGIAGATINNEVGCSESEAEDYADVWYSFTMPTDDNVVITGIIAWNNFALYDACNGNQIDCFSDQGTITGLTSGTTYKLRVFRTLVNVDNDAYKSFTIQTEETLSTDVNTLEDSIRVYPNPANTIINIAMANNQSIASIELFNMLGKRVLTTKALNVDVSKYAAGIYMLKVSTNEGQVTKRIVIE